MTTQATDRAHVSRRVSLFRSILCGLIYAALFGLSLPTADGPRDVLWVLALFAPLPLGYAALMPGRLRYRALGVAIGSMPVWAYTHWWIGDVTALGLPPLVLIMGAYTGMFVLIYGWIIRRFSKLPDWLAWFIMPIVWTCAEMLRGRILFGGYPWYLLGSPMIESSIMRALGSIGGVYLVSAIACVPSAVVLSCVRQLRANKRSLHDAAQGRWQRMLKIRSLQLLVCVFAILAPGVMALESAIFSSIPRITQLNSTVIVLQTNLPMFEKMQWNPADRVRDLELYINMTLRALVSATTSNDKYTPVPIQLIVWPETMFPGMTLSPDAVRAQRDANLGWTIDDSTDNGQWVLETYFHDRLVAFQQSIDIPIVIGAEGLGGLRLAPEGAKKNWDVETLTNSVFLINNGMVHRQGYDKMKLTPFGEYMPIISRWDWLEKQLLALGASGMAFDLDAGKYRVTLPHVDIAATDPARTRIQLATPICFEATVPELCRNLVRAGYNTDNAASVVMVNLTNDGWFGDSDRARAWHLLHARWRCAELGSPMIRAANTGMSTVISRTGLIHPPVLIETQIQSQIQTDDRQTTLAPADIIVSSINESTPAPARELVALGYNWPAEARPTLFLRIGNVWGWACVTITLVLCVFSLRK